MATAVQLTSKSSLGFSNRFNYRLKVPGRLSVRPVVRITNFKLSTGNRPKEYFYDGSWWYVSSSSESTKTLVTSRTFKSRKRSSRVNSDGFRPPTPYSSTFIEIWSDSPSLVHSRYNDSLVVYDGTLFDDNSVPWNYDLLVNSLTGSFPSDLNSVNRAETETLVKLKDMKVNFGEALAESRSTVSHLAKTASTVLKAFAYARKGKWSKVLSELKINRRHRFTTRDPAARWLEIQFGWTPLLSDIKGSFDLFQSGLRSKHQLLSAERNIVSSREEDVCSHTKAALADSLCLFKGTQGVSVKLYARIRDEDIANLTSLGLSDPLQVGWALVPFSFVVDWLLPVGSFLEAVGAVKGLDFVSGTRTEFLNGTMDIHAPYFNRSPSTDKFKAKGSVTAFTRSVYTRFPRPSLYFKSPLSTSHAVSALALFRTIAFKR